MKPMITNGGPHPADKWADMTTDTILELIEVKDDSDTPESAAARAAKRDLRPVLFSIFMDHHTEVQSGERFHLDTIKKHADARKHCEKPLELHDDCHACLGAVVAAFAASPFAAHFSKPEVQAVLHTIIGQHTANVQNIERKWHVDRLAAKGA